ncbi:MAG: RHS repeat-associated core domain-containing protein, partial [Planctomycetota bacterium]
ATDLGDYPITILATDSAGNPGRQSFNLTIRPANTPPTFVTDPVSETLIGNDYFYPALATDDFDDVNYTITGPTGISIDADSGVVSWRAEDVTVGSYPVTITATDARGLSADQPYTLTVGADTEPPTVAIASTSNLLNLGETARISLFAEDNVDVETIEMTIDGLPVTIDSNFGFEYTAETIGIREVVVTATDAAGNSASVELAPFIRVLDPSDTTPPLIEITRPAPGDVVTYLTDIVGSVTDDNLEYYEIQVALSGTNDYRTIVREVFRPGAGGSGITNNLLGVFDPTLLANDTYDVRIEAQDISGNVSRLVSPLSVEAQAKLGNFRIELTDLAVPLAGIPITIDRIYDTLDAPYGYDFGHGWRLDVGSPRIRESVRISEAEQAGGGLFGANAFRAGTRVYINSPSDGRRVGFTFDPVPEPQLLGTLWRPRFVADPGVYDRLEVDDVPLQQNQDGTFGLYLTGFAFNPSEYTLVTKDQLRYVYDQFPNSPSGIQLQSITDRNNVTLAYTENGIFSSVGPSITWTRDDQGRITEILDTAGNPLTYTYTTSGDLESFTDQVGNVTSMTYLDDPAHYLESINDPRGIQVLSLAYDEDGRLTGQGDALGNRTDQSYDLLNNTFVTEDLNGNPTTVVYDDIGNITQEIDALGNATISAYDDPNNVYQETAITDRRGNTTRFEYDDIGNLTLLEEPGRFTRFEYDSFNNNTKITGPFETLADESSARAREFVYDEDGNLAESVDALGNSTFRTVDEFGRVTSLTDRRGNTSTLVYDQLVASPTTIINPDLTTQTFTYDQVGRPLTQANELGTVVSEITYDDAGRVLTTAGADGQLTTNTYDGNLLASQSVKIDTTKSQITQFEYDGNGRIFRQTDANGGIVELTYDPQGNVLSLTDPVQNTTSYQYDVLNRQTVETNPLGNESRFVYDEVDNLVERRDRLGRRIVFIYDAMNRQVDEVWYAMDGSLVETQTYSYDVFGNLLTASSSTSTYSFAYDALDRLTSSSNAGSPETPAVILSYEFDADGNRTRVSDDSGVTIDSEYGSRNQLLSKTWFGGEVEDARVEFDYDDALRQVDILRYSDTTGTNLIGRSETDFDLTGRRTRITHLNSTDEVLANYEYEFDFANRITGQVIDDDTVAYSYDLTGQLFSADHSAPAVPDELYAYDLNGNRTESHLHGTGYITGGNNRLLSDGTSNYEYDDEGNQVRRVSIATGEMTAYEYDHRNRLVRATIRNASGDVTGSSEFVFDVFGRRITSVNDTDGDGPAGAIRENYIYDGENVWADFGETGQILTRYMFGDSIDSNIGRWRVGEESAWYLTDYIGTTRVTLNKAGEIINQTNFDAFGQILDETNESLGDRYKFTGREFDRLTETQYSRTRTYDAETGRFTSLDTISFQGNDPNLYRYVGNAPTIASDPFGTQTLIETQVSLQSVVRALPSIAAVGCILGSGVQVEFIENPGIPNAFAAATVDTVGNAAVVTGGIFAIQGTVIAAGSTITTVGAAGAVGGLVFIGAFVVCLGS